MGPSEMPKHVVQELTERPGGAVPTQRSSTPGRDGENESHVRPVRKEQVVTRFEQEYPKMPRVEFILDDYKVEYEVVYCVRAESDGENASSFDHVLQSKH